MRRLIILTGLILGLFITCKSTTNQDKIVSNENSHSEIKTSGQEIKLEDLLISKSVDTSETFIIKEDCVFAIQMSTKESDSLEARDPDSYESLSENMNNDAMNASELLDRLKIKNFWSDKRFVRFEYGDKKYLIDTRLKDLAGQYCLLFKKNLKPELILIGSLNEEELKKYYKK